MTGPLSDDSRREGLELLRAEADRAGVTAAARRIGYSRPAVSMVLAGTYAGQPDRVLGRALEVLGARECPHLGEPIARSACATHRSRPMPTGSRAAFRHWQACRTCPHNTDGGGDAQQ